MVLTIEEIKEKIRPICEKYRVVKLFLFGSYARGEATAESDVDFYAANCQVKCNTMLKKTS